MSAHRSSALLIGFCLLVSTAEAQTITTNYGADPALNAPRETQRGSVLDYVIPYIPLVGPRWQEKRDEKRYLESAPVQPEAAPPPRKKKQASQTRAAKAKPLKKEARPKPVQVAKVRAPEPAAETLSPPPAAPDMAAVSALTQCLSRFTAREVARGSNASADHLMAQAADRDCGVEFRGLADTITRGTNKTQARQTLETLIRDTLSPAVETAIAEAKGTSTQ